MIELEKFREVIGEKNSPLNDGENNFPSFQVSILNDENKLRVKSEQVGEVVGKGFKGNKRQGICIKVFGRKLNGDSRSKGKIRTWMRPSARRSMHASLNPD